MKPKARGDVKVIVTDQKGSVEEISVKVNPYNLKLENEATSLIIGGYEASTEIAITRGMVIISWHNSQMIIKPI